MPSLLGALPSIEKLKDGESLVVTMSFTEPAITEYHFTFKSRAVIIKKGKKLLGNLAISREDVENIDRFLNLVRRGKKAGRRSLGGPHYYVSLHKAGREIDQWSFIISDIRNSSKPYLSLYELMKRLEKK